MITLKTLPQATQQQVFDQVAKHLLTQNAKSLGLDDQACKYRDYSGHKCAAGCLIDDDEYTYKLEDCGWRVLVLSDRVPETHQYLITSLQSVHDQQTVQEWPKFLRGVASQYKLNTNVLDNHES
jgi:hypothetical protein